MFFKRFSVVVLFVFASYHIGVAQEKEYIKIGGALRFNTIVENYEESNNDLDVGMKLDTWFLNADAHYSGFDLSLQYRFYSDIKNNFLHHAYVGYKINNQWYTKLGVFQRPFGIADFASHSWWFQIPYYMGLEDTYGTGIGTSYSHNKWKVDIAYFHQAPPKGSVADDSADNAVGNGRYSYAIVPTTGIADGVRTDASIRELNQWNGRVRYSLLKDLELGLSLQLGGIYNSVSDHYKWGLNWALHAVYNPGRWNIKAEAIGYDFNAESDNGKTLDVIQMAAYGSAYDVASKGNVYLAGIAYTFPVNKRFITSIQPYFDYSVVVKAKSEYHNSVHIVPGVLIKSGPIYTYIDYAIGKNQPWLTSYFGQGLGEGKSDARWNGRLNINIGYYF
ncbi:porin [Massilibacteroides sp.]|uniref:porin n=1 Tax=Massilibacteroides sp. TaxID=2034766 RepID=UPI00262468F3|nr:porin [Massilibacteroides sp.]MDD4514499.1 porin [Massilibacteroides sp.]